MFFHIEKDALVDSICEEHSSSIVYKADLDYRDWEAGIDFSSFEEVGLTIAPFWHPEKADIKIDPSVIFGSGFHPTTRQCLQSLLTIIRDTENIHKVYDFGCGTGLLGIAAAKRGAKNVLAVDYNGLACQVTQANALKNQLQEQVKVSQLDLTTSLPDTSGIDLVIANLHHPLLIKLFENPFFWRAGFYIFSGFFSSREEELLCALPEGHQLRFLNRHSNNKWGTWVIQNNGCLKGASQPQRGHKE